MMIQCTKVLSLAFWTMSALAVVRSDDLRPLYYESFESGKESGVVGKAGAFQTVDARGLVDFDRGTLAFFIRADKLPILEWAQFGGVHGRRIEGYWGMILGFDRRLEDFVFNFYDTGRYSPPLKFAPCLGRWKEGEWHHLAAVWDRNEGMTIYEDGKRVAGNWGESVREWNFVPQQLFVNGVADELYVFAEPLTDEQIAQLAKGQKPTGAAIPITPAENRRANDLARMGWSGENLASLPAVESGKPQTFTFARFTGCVDANRPVAEPFWGFPGSTWPLDKYGASIRGEHLDIHLAAGQSYDRVRVCAQRRFAGEFKRATPNGREETVVPLDAEQAGIWHRKLPAALTDSRLVLKRKTGALGEIAFYRVEPLKRQPSGKDVIAFALAKAENFPDSEIGRFFKAETPSRFWQPLLATPSTGDAWSLDTPAFGGFQATAEPLQEAKAFDGALVTLVAEGLTEPTPIRITIKEPVHTGRDWLVADAVLQPKGNGKQTFTMLLKGRPVINMPTLQMKKYLKDGKYSDEVEEEPGAGFGFSVTTANPVKWRMGKDSSSIAFSLADMQKAMPVAAEDQEEFMREAYAEVMEGHAYSDPLLVIPMKWLAKFAPERMKFRQMYERVGSPQWFVGINVPKLVYEEPKNTTGAPEWAFWQMQAMKEHWRILHWYIDKVQLWNGELGGVWNDDTDHIENWYDHALCMDDDDKIKNAIRKFCDGLWNYQLEEGVGKYVQDACHFYEEGMGNMGMRLLIDYGDPIPFARALSTCSHFDKWMRQKPDGKYEWISEYMSVNGAWTAREFGSNPGYGGHKYDILVPGGYLVWYNRHPVVAKIYRGLDCKGGFHGAAHDRVTDFSAAKKRYAEEMLKPAGRGGPREYLIRMDELGVSEELRNANPIEFKAPGPIAHYWGSHDTDGHYANWRLTGDTRWLVESYKRVCEWFHSHDWLNSEARPCLDRNPLPRGSLIRARMGSIATNRGASGLTWPLHGLSYTRGANEVAALVTVNLDTQLEARFYSFPENPHEMQLRVWRLHPGTYKVALFNDKNDDGKPEDAIMQKEMTIDRGAHLDLTLPPKQCSILSITPIQTQEPNYDKPDPAISLATCDYVYTEHLVVHVYNNGTKPVENLLVRVRDGRSGRVVVSGEQMIARIDAPLDFKPRQKAVEFKNINANTCGSIIIEIDPENKIDDLNRYNNRVVLTY
ncbi:MAG: hypothetical protein HY360_13465 [Verrucomicrobia bacterium]|nr:hypothetical protein [Verrucomicrobiota bacterium]